MIEIGYNYYKNEHYLKTGKVVNLKTLREEKTAQNSVGAQAEKANPNSANTNDVDLLESVYANVAAKNRSNVKNDSELFKQLNDKYYNKESSSYVGKGYTQEEIKAMYNNEKTMTKYGTLQHSADLNDPNLTSDIKVSTQAKETKKASRDIINQQITNVLESNGIKISKSDFLKIDIDSNGFNLEATGLNDEETLAKVNEALNYGNNAKELFYHLLQSSEPVSEDVLTKFKAAQEMQNVTGLTFDDLSYSDGKYLTSNGEDIVDVYKKAMEISTKVPELFKGSVINYFRDFMETLSVQNAYKIPDLQVTIGYMNNKLVDLNVNEAV